MKTVRNIALGLAAAGALAFGAVALAQEGRSANQGAQSPHQHRGMGMQHGGCHGNSQPSGEHNHS